MIILRNHRNGLNNFLISRVVTRTKRFLPKGLIQTFHHRIRRKVEVVNFKQALESDVFRQFIHYRNRRLETLKLEQGRMRGILPKLKD